MFAEFPVITQPIAGLLGVKYKKVLTLYEALGVAENAPMEEIKEAGRVLIRRVAPDQCDIKGLPKEEREWRIAECTQAFIYVDKVRKILLDPGMRREYDTYLSTKRGKRGAEALAADFARRQTPGAVDFDILSRNQLEQMVMGLMNTDLQLTGQLLTLLDEGKLEAVRDVFKRLYGVEPTEGVGEGIILDAEQLTNQAFGLWRAGQLDMQSLGALLTLIDAGKLERAASVITKTTAMSSFKIF